jgi:tetratricopeptide (TPR) repeat protein
LINLGFVYFRLTDYEKAEETWRHALKIYPGHPVALNFMRLLGAAYLGKALETYRGGDVSGAEALAEKAALANPGDASLWCGIGDAFRTLKQYPKARRAWKLALKVKPDYEEVKKRLAALEGMDR